MWENRSKNWFSVVFWLCWKLYTDVRKSWWHHRVPLIFPHRVVCFMFDGFHSIFSGMPQNNAIRCFSTGFLSLESVSEVGFTDRSSKLGRANYFCPQVFELLVKPTSKTLSKLRKPAEKHRIVMFWGMPVKMEWNSSNIKHTTRCGRRRGTRWRHQLFLTSV